MQVSTLVRCEEQVASSICKTHLTVQPTVLLQSGSIRVKHQPKPIPPFHLCGEVRWRHIRMDRSPGTYTAILVPVGIHPVILYIYLAITPVISILRQQFESELRSSRIFWSQYTGYYYERKKGNENDWSTQAILVVKTRRQ